MEASVASRLLVAVAVCGFSSAHGSDAPPAEFARWAESGFDRAEHRAVSRAELYPRGKPQLLFELDLTVLWIPQTPWTQVRALHQLRRTADILATCRIALHDIRLVRLALPAAQRRMDVTSEDPRTGVPPAVARLSALLPETAARPAAFLVGQFVGTDLLAISYRAPPGSLAEAPYFDTAWISYPAHWRPRADERYSALAHELAHLMCRCGHKPTADRHLLHASRNFLSSRVLPEHCEAFRNSPLLRFKD